MKKYGIVGVLLLGIVFLAGMPFDSDYEFADFHGWGSEGLNLFSLEVGELQALDLVNLLFEGNHVRSRKGLTKINLTSLGGYGVNGLLCYNKASDFSQILACYNGKVYYLDPDSTDFSDYITDRTITVSMTNDDSLVTGSGTFFNLLGYQDSIEILINDTTHYIHEIIDDTHLTLYSQWKGGTGAAATLTQPFYVDAVNPILMDMWMGDAFIAGTEKMGFWDGNTLSGDLGDTTSFKITAIEVGDGCDLKLTVTPTLASEGYDFGDLVGYYIYGYNDTTTDTAQAAGNHPIFNKPLEITIQGSDYIYVWADSFWVADQEDEEWRHLDTNSLFKIMLPPTSEKLVFAGVIDSLHAVGNGWIDTCGGYYCHQWINAYDSSQTWDKHALNFGTYELRIAPDAGTPTPSHSNVFLRADGNGVVYMQAFYKNCVAWAQGDSFEIYRLYSSGLQDVPKYYAFWMDRAWYAGYGDDPNLILYSDEFDPDSLIAGSWFIYVDRDDGDVITALVVMPFQDYLLVFKKKSIMAITTTGLDPYDFTVNDIVQGIGTPSQASIVMHGRNVYFYDYNGWYNLNGIEPIKISWAIEKIVRDSVNQDYAHLIVGGYFDNHLWWSYPSGDATKNDRTILYNLQTEKWTKVDLNLASMYVGIDENATNGVLLSSADSGVVWTYTGYFDDGASITGTYLSGWLGMNDPYESNKEFKDFQCLLDKHDSTQIYIDMYKNYSASTFTKDTIGIDDNDVLTYKKRTIEGYNKGQRLQIGMTITRMDGTFRMPFFKVKWKPTDEVHYDE